MSQSVGRGTDQVIVAFAREDARRKIARLLSSGGLQPTALCGSGGEVIRAARRLDGCVVICGFRLPDMTAEALAEDLLGLASVLVVSSAERLELCHGENLCKLTLPAGRADLFAALEMLEYQEPPSGRPPRQEKEQQIILRAKELLMDENRMTEPEAHRFLQKRSMDCGMRMVDMSLRILHSHGIDLA